MALHHHPARAASRALLPPPATAGLTVFLSLLLALSSTPCLRSAGVVQDCAAESFLTALQGGGLVRLQCDGTISLTNQILITTDTIIDATGSDVTLDAGSLTRFFQVESGVQLVLLNLTLSNGAQAGLDGAAGQNGQTALAGAIYNNGGLLSLTDCVLFNNHATGGEGGAGENGSLASGPSGQKGGHGGGAFGGAVYNQGTLFITNCTFAGNSASGGQGGQGGNGISFGNGTDGGDGGRSGSGRGGAIFNALNSHVTIQDTFFNTNSVSGAPATLGGLGSGGLGFNGAFGSAGSALGAAIYDDGGTLTANASTLAGNFAIAGAGANGRTPTVTRDGESGSRGGTASGGAIYNRGTLLVTNLTLFGNMLVGGPGGIGGNAAGSVLGREGGDGGDGGNAFGGAVYNESALAGQIVNASFLRNSVRAGNGGTNGLGSGSLGSPGDHGDAGIEAGAAIFNASGTLHLKNSALGPSLSGPNVGGTVIDGGFNLNADNSLTMLTRSSRNSTDPLLLSLTNQFGPTPVLPLATNSPAIDAITAMDGNGCPTEDQRHFLRTFPCDIGAYEFNGDSPFALTGTQTNLLLTWPLSWNDITVQTSSALTTNTAWTNLTNPPVLKTNQQHQLTLPLPTNNQAFFRLRSP